MCLLKEYDPDVEPIDHIFYVEKQYLKPITQILSLIYKKEFDSYDDIIPDEKRGRKRGKKGKIYTYISEKYIDTWIKMLKYKSNLCYDLRDFVGYMVVRKEYDFPVKMLHPDLIASMVDNYGYPMEKLPIDLREYLVENTHSLTWKERNKNIIYTNYVGTNNISSYLTN